MDELLYRLMSLPRRVGDLPFPLRVESLGGWLVVLVFLLGAVPIVWMGMRSMAGLGPVRKWVAIGMRLTVLLLALLVLAGVEWRRENKDVEVLVLRDTSDSTTQVKSFPGPDTSLQPALDRYFRRLADDPEKSPADRIGVISFQQSAYIDALPERKLELGNHGVRGAGAGGAGTDPAAAIQLGLASLSRDALHRMLLVWDGNATAGDLDAALAAAASQHVPIDVMPLRYDLKNEVRVDRFIAPTWKREGEPFSLDIVLQSTNAVDVTGTLTVLDQGVPIDLDPTTPTKQTTRPITLKPGLNRQTVHIPGALAAGVHQFRAIFEPSRGNAIDGVAPRASIDTLSANNVADAFTFVHGRGRILYVDGVRDAVDGALLPQALKREDINLVPITPDAFPNDLLDLTQYDAVILANVSRGALGERREALLARYVHDTGGGLVMIGGDDTLGAGGWQGSELERVLPVDMDVPAQRQIPQGALVIVIDRSGSMGEPFGANMSKQQAVNQAAILALRALSEKDLVGVVAFDAEAHWLFPLQENRHPDHLADQLRNIGTGGGTFIFPGLSEAATALEHCHASARHILLLTDGQTQPADYAPLLARMRQRKISLSTIGVGNDADTALLARLASDGHGRFYNVTTPQALPQVFIKEAMVVRRSLIQESDTGFMPHVLDATDDFVKGLTPQPVFGLVLTTRKPDPLVQMPLAVQTGESKGTLDPLLAHWQAGLGRAAVFTSDATSKWAARWVASDGFAKFWAQVVRGVARPPMSTDFDVTTTVDAVTGKGRIVIDALDKDNRFLNFLTIAGNVMGPDLRPQPVRPVQTGPGHYEATFDADAAGTYVVGLSYAGKDGSRGGQLRSGAAVNLSPEFRDLHSNEARLREVATRTGGRLIDPPFDASAARAFRREGLYPTAIVTPIWDELIPVLLALFLVDVAVRRLALDRDSLERFTALALGYIRSHTTTRQVETRDTVDALTSIRHRREHPEMLPAAPPPPKPPGPQADAPTATLPPPGDALAHLRAAKQRARDRTG